MLTTSARLLRLLALLQVPGLHSGPALAARLGVSVRTVRGDVSTLRGLGYPIEAIAGAAGGYRFGSGSRLPPLTLDDEEAVAVALGLTTSIAYAATDTADAALRALSKIITMLPTRLKPQLAALAKAARAVPVAVTPVAADALQAIAVGIQRREHLRFAYADASGTTTHREVEPYRIVLRGGRWYLVAWDPERADWRTFRVDRMRVKTPNGRRFAERPGPAEGFESYVVKQLDRAVWHSHYEVRLLAPAAAIRKRAPQAVEVRPDGADACIVAVGSDNPAALARYLSWWEVPFEVLDAPELQREVELLAERYAAATGRCSTRRANKCGERGQ